MIKHPTLQALTARISVFQDTPMLAEQLRAIAEENAELGIENYWLREAAENLDGLWEVMCEAMKLQAMADAEAAR